MARRRLLLVAGPALAVCLAALTWSAVARAETVPARLTDKEFWSLVADLSEEDGFFRSDNLLSNEFWFQDVIPDLVRIARPGRVYMGVGPEQNFTYIAALKPSMAFIVDIRRGNLDLHLMYKAIFELSANRSEFVSRLFSREYQGGMTPRQSVVGLFSAYRDLEPNEELYRRNLKAIIDQLEVTHGFVLSEEDRQGIEYVLHAFYMFGPRLQYTSTSPVRGTGANRGPVLTYENIMTRTDSTGEPRSYLATEEAFKVVKDLETRNLIVPVIGNFGGDTALRSVASYLTQHGATVSAFYLSNVEQYLRQDSLWENFCVNVTALPLDATSTFIRSIRGGANGIGLNSVLGQMAAEVERCRPPAR